MSVCLFVCPRSKRKTAWAINTKLGTHTGWAKKVILLVQCNICTRGITFLAYSSRSACIDSEVKRLKVKVTGVSSAPGVDTHVDSTTNVFKFHQQLIDKTTATSTKSYLYTAEAQTTLNTETVQTCRPTCVIHASMWLINSARGFMFYRCYFLFFKCRPSHSTTGRRIATRIVALTPSMKGHQICSRSNVFVYYGYKFGKLWSSKPRSCGLFARAVSPRRLKYTARWFFKDQSLGGSSIASL